MSRLSSVFSRPFMLKQLVCDNLSVQKRYYHRKSKPFLVQLLSNDTPKLGKLGDVIPISRGYYRNVLFLKKQALAVSAVDLKGETEQESASTKGQKRT
ncbi:ribosomal protein subunit L9 [Schizosaccharomyces cryophilus OY26]|uniref:Ribosomal protein subunit L9 n=1 Tax=Schizosaccharomyces cryophilus (strain OY26 / ATCC MYA-4695 / CBS 11777 / NBRC 106824 / NRRL Y48691) TaxID=653667 RepID=S9VU95_SCHCR|nr:ribosomal protein subunit L9 [Schizosaccharomyces cryophilus OY26]EPY51343.1 ribosomal protein subunit L9 [Schizosaccharomyces cryophilus OY26]